MPLMCLNCSNCRDKLRGRNGLGARKHSHFGEHAMTRSCDAQLRVRQLSVVVSRSAESGSKACARTMSSG